MKKIVNWLKGKDSVARYLALYDYFSIGIAYFVALLVRFDGSFSSIPKEYWDVYAETILIFAYVAVIINWFFGLYRSIWMFASFYEVKQSICALAISVMLYA